VTEVRDENWLPTTQNPIVDAHENNQREFMNRKTVMSCLVKAAISKPRKADAAKKRRKRWLEAPAPVAGTPTATPASKTKRRRSSSSWQAEISDVFGVSDVLEGPDSETVSPAIHGRFPDATVKELEVIRLTYLIPVPLSHLFADHFSASCSLLQAINLAVSVLADMKGCSASE
jgi:hypothetical protein